MKKPLKILRIVLLAILILVVAGVVVITLFAGQAVKTGIEKAASKTLNVGVSIDDVDMSILGGKVGLQNLKIDNPPGYQHDKLLQLQNAKIEVDIRSLLSDTVNIREIELDGMNVVLEQKGVSSNNIQDVIKSIQAGRKAADKTATARKTLRIDTLKISDVTVNAKLLPVPGTADTATFKLSPITMTDLGSDDKLDAAVLSAKIMLAIADGVAREGVGVLPENIINPMKSTLSKIRDIDKTLFEQAEKLIDTGKDAEDELMKGLKGLLKPKKEEEEQ
jgi:hypothetical protein